MTTNFEMVREFHAAFGVEENDSPRLLADLNGEQLRLALIEEEYAELDEALADQDIVATVDALGDMLYVIYGFGATMGVDLDRVFAEIHRSNMTKLGGDGRPLKRSDGKIVKGPHYEPPNLHRVLREQG